MQTDHQFNSLVYLLICINILLQITAFSLMKLSWIHAQNSIVNLMNYITLLAFSASFLRACVWQCVLKLNDLSSSYLANAIVPSLLVCAGHFFFHESITIFNILGSLIILTGLIILIKSTRSTTKT